MLAIHPHNLTPAQALAARDTHGLGIIHDATEARLIRRVNGDRSLRLTCPWTEKNANLLIADRLICYDGQFYRITIPSRRERAGKKAISLEAPHVMYDLRYSYIVNIETAEDEATIDGITGTQAMTQVLAGTPFTPGTVDVDAEKLEYLDLLEVPRTAALEQIIDRWGGEIVPDNWTINLREQSGTDRGLQIRVGKNIDGVEMTEDINEVVTRLHVLGYQGANFEEINGGKNYLDSAAIGKYAFVREDYVTFDDDEDPEILMQKGLEELEKLDKPKLTVRINMVRVRGSRQYSWYKDLERVDEGDTVTVHHEFLGQNVKLRAMEVETDCLTDNVISVTLAETGTDGLFQGFSSFVRTTELVRKILDHDGHVRARTLRGEIDLLTTRLIASGSYQNASVIAGKGALLENTNTSSPDYGALYIGPGILAIADAKNTDGTWEWRTFGTGKGFSGSEILAYSITGTKIQAHTIGVEHLVPEIFTEVTNNATGQQLVLECSHGTILDEGSPTTTVRLRVYFQGVDVTDRIPDSAVRWERVSDDAAGDALWNAAAEHNGTKTVTITSADVDWHGVLRCLIGEVQLYAVPEYIDGQLVMVDQGTGEADSFSVGESGELIYTGETDYTAGDDGSLRAPMVVGASVIEITLQNLKTSYMSIARQGIDIFADGKLRLRTGGDMLIEAGAGFNLRAGSGNKAIGISNNHDQEYVHWAGSEVPANAPFYVKRDGSVRATKLQLDNSNISDFTQMYPYSEAENADANNPVVFRIFVPAELSGVQSLKLSFIREPFRAYSTGAASGGGATSSTGGGAEKTSRSGGGQTKTSTPSDAYTSQSPDLSTGLSEAFPSGTSSPGTNPAGTHAHTITNHRHSYTMGASDTGYTQPSSVNAGDHSHSVNSHSHNVFGHSHPIGQHVHTLNNHTHNVEVSAHTHIVDIDAHTHTVPEHSHAIVYGIYQGPVATSCSVYVDGTYIGAWASLVARDITSYLTMAGGKVTRDAWHTIQIFPNSLSRVVAQVFLIALVNQATNAIY